jgi:hypothetical protein
VNLIWPPTNSEPGAVATGSVTKQLGEKYLVYARTTDDNRLVAQACTRTRVLSSGQSDIAQLDLMNPGAYHASSLSPVSLVRYFLSRESNKADSYQRTELLEPVCRFEIAV